MKKHFFSLLTILFLTVSLTGQNLTFSPEKPKAGEKITITYQPEDTPLAGAADIEGTLYVLEAEGNKYPELKAYDLPLKAEGDKWVADWTASAPTKSLFVSFSSGSKLDNNGGEGYRVILYSPDRRQPAPGALYSLSVVYHQLGRAMRLDLDLDKAMDYLKQEFETYPESKNYPVYFTEYARQAAGLDDPAAAQAEVRARLNALTAKKKKTEEEWVLAHDLAQTLDESDLQESLAADIEKQFPRGAFAKQKLVERFYSDYDPEAQEKVFKALQKVAGPEDKETIGSLAVRLAGAYGSDDWAKFDYYMALGTDKQYMASTYNDLAWNMAGAGLDGEAGDMARAQQFSRRSLDLIKALQEGPAKPGYMPPKMQKQQLDYLYGLFSDTYALIRYRQGDAEEALTYQQIYCEQSDFANGEGAERYTVYLEKAKGPEAALDKLEDLIRHGKATELMKEQYQRLFAAQYTPEQASAKYLAALEREALQEYKKELRKNMLDEAAPAFTLKNLEGEDVSLASLRGKTVVLDFWATWCGPCKASFPGMQRTVEKFKDNPDVVFLFVDTWESAENKEKNASEFITENNYTFHVLMDNDNKVVGDFQVEGIPTKFVVDPQGRVRFKSVGYNGNADKLVDEMTIMIELAAEAGPKGTAMK